MLVVLVTRSGITQEIAKILNLPDIKRRLFKLK